MKRPLAYTGAAFFFALIIVNIFGFNCGIVMGLFCVVLSIILGTIPLLKRMRIWAIPCFSAFLACVIFCLGIGIYAKPVERELAGKTLNVNATVTEISFSDDYSIYTVKSEMTFSDGKTRWVKYRFYHMGDILCEPYDILNCNIHFSKLDNDYADSNYARNIFINAQCVSDVSVTPASSRPFLYYPLKCRQFLISAMRGKFDEECAGLICGILTGDKSYMSAEVKENVRISGLSHITAVSGLHISIFATFTISILAKTNLRKRYRYLLTLLPLWFFVLIAGAPYSTIRSAFMFTVMIFGIGIFRRNDPISSLFGALMICGFVSPFSALDVGLLSSASSTFGLLVLTSPLKEYIISKLPERFSSKKWVKYTVLSFAQTTSAVTGLLPCSVLFYKNFSLVVLISNLTVLPLVTVLLSCSLLGGVLYYVTVISNPLLFTAGIVAKIILWLCKMFASIPFAEISIARSYITATLCAILILTAVAIGFVSFGKGGRRMIALLIVASILCLSLSVVSYNFLNRDRVEIFVLDQGNTPCALVIYKGETLLFCDSPDYDLSRRMGTLLRSLGRHKVDYMVVQENIGRGDLEFLTEKIKIEKYCVQEDLENRFPVVATNKAEINYVKDTFVTPKGVRVDFYPKRSEIFVEVNNFSMLILNRNLDYADEKFKSAGIVVLGATSLDKLKSLSFSAPICCCDYDRGVAVSEFYLNNKINGVYTGGYGTIRVCGSKKGDFSLSRIE